MGIPALFKTFTTKYSNILESTDNIETDILCFDFNCLIHHCKNELKEDFKNIKNQRNQEEVLIVEIIGYFNNIIKMCNPEIVYISIDGVVPYGKMKQQRYRRFKSNTEINNCFDSNKISPGTSFMSKLCARIKNLMTIGIKEPLGLKRKTKFYFNDVNVPGEGEAKLMKFLDQQDNSRKVIIYGLDADLIILSMLRNSHKIKLLREYEDSFTLLNINNLKKSILNDYNISIHTDPERFFKDFTALSFLGGNDFVEPLPSCKIRDGGMKRIMNAYQTICKNKYIVDENNNINYPLLLQIIQNISKSEEDDLVKIYDRIYNNRDPVNLEEVEHAFYSNPMHPEYSIFLELTKNIQFQNPYTWWNQIWFTKEKDSVTKFNKVINEYFKSIEWCKEYYLNSNVIDWNYFYPYEVAPLAKDFTKIKTKLEFNETSKIPLPFEQLFYIMPCSSFSLFPKNYQQWLVDPDSPIKTFYEKTLKMNILKGLKGIYTEPLFDYNIFEIQPIVIQILKNCPVTKYEINRNTVRDNHFFKFC